MPLTFLTLFLTFLKAGGLTVGDGFATIQPLRQALVKQNKWMTDEDFSEALAVVQAMPGIFNINFAVYLGKRLSGWQGSAASLMGMSFPPIVILIVFATFFNDFRQFHVVASFLRGARPAIVAIIAIPCFQLWKRSGITLSTVWIPVGVAIAVGLLGVSPTFIVVALAVLGLLYGVLVRGGE